MTPPPSTGSSTLLLFRLSAHPTDGSDWAEFVRRYGGVIYRWCRRHGLQDSDAQDVTQDVFSAVLRAVGTFDRGKGRVRTWLYRIVSNRIIDGCSGAGRHHERGTDEARRALSSIPAGRELEARLGEEFDLELLELAEMGVRLQVKPEVWASYVCRCKEGLALRDAAARIGIPAGHVSKYALRVQLMVARRVELLEGGDDEPAGEVANGPGDRLPAPGDVAGLHS